MRMRMHTSCGTQPNYDGLLAETYLQRHESFRTPQFPGGLGDAPPLNIPALTTTLATVGTATGALIAGSTLFGSLAGPIGAAAGIVAGLIQTLIANSGCGQTCVLASDAANQLGDALATAMHAYLDAPVHTQSMQQAYIALFNQSVQALQSYCSNPQLGAAGKRCISERLVRGGTAPWCPNPGGTGCGWYETLLDPVANDPTVVPDSQVAGASPESSVSGAVSSVADTVSSVLGGISPTFLMLAAAGLILASSLGPGKGH